MNISLHYENSKSTYTRYLIHCVNKPYIYQPLSIRSSHKAINTLIKLLNIKGAVMVEPPKPIITRPNYSFELRSERKAVREGRGFSLGELQKAGISIQEAKRLKIRIDKRRKSVHEENVKVLKEYVEKVRTESKKNEEGKK